MIELPIDAATVTCPTCSGHGSSWCHVDGTRPDGTRFGESRIVACDRCSGSGTITPEAKARYDAGRRRADERKAAGRTLREEAKRLGVSAKELSDIEWGRV